jgi:hypothetical protein
MQEGQDRGVHLEVRGVERPVLVNGDRARVAAGLKALMQSALRERAEPGVVVVECASVDGTPGWGHVAIGDETIVASLAEPAESSPPFDEWRGGLGLALPVARRVIEAHGGQLWSADGAQSRTACALRIPLRT